MNGSEMEWKHYANLLKIIQILQQRSLIIYINYFKTFYVHI